MAENNIDSTFEGFTRCVTDTYSYINKSTFYTCANPTYIDYYVRTIRPIAQWLDGYVNNFHSARQGIFSTRMAASLVKGVANQIVGKRIMFKTSNKDGGRSGIQKLNDWQNKGHFQQAVRNAVKFAVGLGTSLLKINTKMDGTCWLEPIRLDSFWFSSDFSGELTEVYSLIKNYGNVLPSGGKPQKQNYYLVEHRYYVEERVKKVEKLPDGTREVFVENKLVPMIEYGVKTYSGQILNDTAAEIDINQQQALKFDSIPSNIRNSIKKDYGQIRIGEPSKLPFENLGCILLKFDGSDISLPSIPFGTSLLQDILSYLAGYDMAYSYMMRDIYQGKGFILSPESYIKSAKQFQNMQESPFNGIADSLVVKLPTNNPDDSKIEQVQFNLRAQEWEIILDDILKRIATTIGMSPRTIAAYLEDSSHQKTATEIDAEDDATIAFIEIKRGIFEEPINELVRTILRYMGCSDEVKILFGTPTLVNRDKVIEREIKKLESGLTTIEDAVKAIYDEEDEDQVRERLERIRVEQDQKLQQEQRMNSFGFPDQETGDDL